MNFRIEGDGNIRDIVDHRNIVSIATPTGEIRVLRSVAERLLQDGLISGDLDGVLHAADAAIVKAAMMGTAGACDFCGAPGATDGFQLPDFDMGAGIWSTGGWAACDTCAALVRGKRHKDLFARTTEALAFSKYHRRALEDLHARFWKGMKDQEIAEALALISKEFIDNTPREGFEMIEEVWKAPREQRVDHIVKLSGLTHAEVERMVSDGDVTDLIPRLLKWRERIGLRDDGSVNQAAAVRSVLERLGAPAPPLKHVQPHWLTAMDMQYSMLAAMTKALQQLQHDPQTITYENPTNLHDVNELKALAKKARNALIARELDFHGDVTALRRAETFSFNAETVLGIQQATESIPHESPLSSIETPALGAGWFWFSDPIQLASSPAASDVTNALLWAWEESDKGPALRFSTYVVDTKGTVGPESVLGLPSYSLFPSTRWYWPLSMSLHEMIAFQTVQYREFYKSENVGAQYGRVEQLALAGEAQTMKVVTEMSLFFLAACMWFKQKVLVSTPQHIERHARKRIQREHKLSAPPSVRVIALRASYHERSTTSSISTEAGGEKREYDWRWVVSGHARLQPVGPGRTERKLIWIDPYVKGPDDKPLRERKKVFAVIR